MSESLRRKPVVVPGEKCYSCGAPMEGRIENYKYTECGLKSVTLQGIVVFHCSQCGAVVPEINNMSELHYTIALAVATKETRLLGEEVRFLRKVLGYSATELAKLMGTTKSVVSRWENHDTLGNENDRVIRLLCWRAIIRQMLERHDAGQPEGQTCDFSDRAVELLDGIEATLKNIQGKKAKRKNYVIPNGPTIIPASWGSTPQVESEIQ